MDLKNIPIHKIGSLSKIKKIESLSKDNTWISKEEDPITDTINKNEFEKFANIDGIGETQINSLKNFFSNQINKNIFLELQDILEIQNQKNIKNGALSNNTFMFTGKLDGISRAEAKSLIEKKSGITVSTISKNLNYLVIGEKPTKRKVENAKNLGIKILSKEDFVKLLD